MRANLRNRWFFLLLPLLFARLSMAVVLNWVDVPKERLIVFIFVGHSNMTGYGGVMDTVKHPRAWMYNQHDKKYWQACDPIETKKSSPSPTLPFLKKMAELYPEYYFCGLKVTNAGTPMSEHFLRGQVEYQMILDAINSIKTETTLGGVLAMFGLAEGISDSLSQRLTVDVMDMLFSFREDFGVPDLPAVFGLFEENADTSVIPDYFTYSDRIIEQIAAIPGADTLNRSALTPYEPVPADMYFDDHHYNENGYVLWSNTASEIVSQNLWDEWDVDSYLPLSLKSPWGGEKFCITDTLPVRWAYNPDSLSEIVIHISLDSGTTWELISGAAPLPAQSDTFYWIPSESTLELRDKDILLRIMDQGGKYRDSANFFSIIMPNTPPVFTSIPIRHAIVDSLYTYTVTTTDDDSGAVLSITAVNLPSWLGLTDNGDGTALITGTPDTAVLGDHPITLNVTDGIISQPVQQLFTISVLEKLPPLSLQHPQGGELFSIVDTIPITWIYNPDSLSRIMIFLSLDTGKTWEKLSGDSALNAELSIFHWLPAQSILELIGKDLLLHIASDDEVYSDTSDSFSIYFPNNTPEFTSVPLSEAKVDRPYSYNVTASDADSSAVLMFASVNLPSWLVLTDSGNGTAVLAGVPDSADLGDHSITLTVTDGIIAQPVMQVFTLSVSYYVLPLVLTNPLGGETFDESDTVPVTWTYNPDSLSLILVHCSLDSGKIWHLLSGDAGLAAELQLFNWIPAQSGLDFYGKNVLLRLMNYGKEYTDKSNFFSVIVPNRAPVFTSKPAFTGREGVLYTYTITATDADSLNSLRVETAEIPGWLTLTDSGDGTALLTGTPLKADVGINIVVLTLTDKIIEQPVLQSFAVVVEPKIAISDDINSYQTKPSTFTVAPNPSKDRVNFSLNFSGAGEAQLMVFDAMGNTVYKTAFSHCDKTLKSWNLTNRHGKRVEDGTYLAVVRFVHTDGTIELLKCVLGAIRK